MTRFASLLLSFGLAAAPAVAAPVHVESGALAGHPEGRIAGVEAFYGVPYAAPPIGPLRWREPQPAARWSGVRAADAFGPRCEQQPLYSDMRFRSKGVGEDCLYLNVWRPATARRGAKLPVLVYIHGGGFVAGSGDELRYDGASLAARGIVVVTINYRLGAFGMFSHPELTAGSPHHASGNEGLLDQAAAIAWVRRNVAAFGGDPRHITIGGESAGSMSVSALMASPLVRTEIAGAIGESGSLLGPGFDLPTQAQADAKGQAWAATLGAPTLAALRAMPADQLLAAQASAPRGTFGEVVDGYFFDRSPAETYAAGRQAPVPLLVGSNSQEGPASAILGNGPATLATYRAGLQRLFGERAGEVERLYPAADDADVTRAATELASDRFLAWNTWAWFDAQRRSGAPTFYYRYARVRPLPVDGSQTTSAWGAVHSAEIEYALGNLDANPEYRWTDDDRRTSATMEGYWANFVRTGNPNGPGLPSWPRAAVNGPIARMTIDVTSAAATFADQARYPAAETFMGR